jgi:nitroreductase
MGTVTVLPEPDKSGSMPLERAIAVRRSRRDFRPEPVTIEQVGQLLWAAQGREQHSLYRTCPSAGATYPLEVFVVTPQGFFVYLPGEHALQNLSGTCGLRLHLPPGLSSLLRSRR